MNLLKEGIETGVVIATAISRKITIGGITQTKPVYRIRLDLLFYNDLNDRIATWISQYKNEHDGQTPDPTNREVYNAIIEKFIIESMLTQIYILYFFFICARLSSASSTFPCFTCFSAACNSE